MPTPGTTPVAAFFQPERNIPLLASWGINTFFGPEVESPKNLTPLAIVAKEQQWIEATRRANAWCVLKRPIGDLPDNCYGVCLSVDEPNGKQILPTDPRLVNEAADYRLRYPSAPIFLSLAGDKVHSANFLRAHESQLYLDYAALCDVMTVNFYSANRNVTRYPMRFTAEACKKLSILVGKPVWPWIECNDQQLPPPKPADGVNRAPTPEEIDDTVLQCVQAFVPGIGFFFTCDSGKYGWGVGNTDFATRGDSYLPLIDRNGASMKPQYDKVAEIAKRLAPPPAPAKKMLPVEVLTVIHAEGYKSRSVTAKVELEEV